MTTRRELLGLTGVAALGWQALGGASVEKASQPLDILFLGGTGFIGPHQIRYALARGHRVSMFNRGKRNRGIFGDQVEELYGDRDDKKDAGLSALKNDRKWDVVIDNSGYVPRHVEDSVALLKDRCQRYVYISTVAVYDFEAGLIDFEESGPLAKLADPTVETVTGETYGPLKAACDLHVQDALGSKATVVRPTYIVGPGDHTDRFTYWVERVMRGGDILAPNSPDSRYQWIDARDMCPWIVQLAEENQPGVFNACGPRSDVTRAGLMWGLRAMTPASVSFHWPSADLIRELEINQPTFGLEDNVSFSPKAALAAGMPFRSLAETAMDTHEWWLSQPESRRANPRGWLTPEAEAEAIARISR